MKSTINRLFLYFLLSLLIQTTNIFASDDEPAAAAGHPPAHHRVCTCGDHDCAASRADIPHGKASSGRWIDVTTPKRGWTCVDILDNGTGELVRCDMCQREDIRWKHVMRHGGFAEDLEVGCICAGYMEGVLNPQDKDAPGKQRERYVHTRATWMAKLADDTSWKKSKRSGKDYFPLRCRSLPNVDIYVARGKFGGYAASIRNLEAETFSNVDGWHASRLIAAQTAFTQVFPSRPPWM